MNWDDLRVFLAVARAGGLSGAAQAARMDPATLSRRIARLEEAMGVALFLKSPTGYALTEAGERMLDHAAEAEIALARATEDAAAASAGLGGQVRIGAPDGCANYLLPQVCAGLQADNPGLEIQILALPRAVNLSQREADFAITVSPPQAGRLQVRKITDYHLHLAAREDVAAGISSRADLKGLPVVGYIPDMIFDKELDYLGDLGRSGVQLASNSVAVQAQLLRAGRGVGIVHDFALPQVGGLRRVLVEEVSLTRSFYLVRHPAAARSDRLTRLAGALADGLRAEVKRLESLLA